MGADYLVKIKESKHLHHLIVNLSPLIDRPTGISNYSQNIFSSLKVLDPILFESQKYHEFNSYVSQINLISSQGLWGHLNRLIRTQIELPRIYKKLKLDLIFSTLPEAPLWSQCRTVLMVHDIIPLHFPNFSPLTAYYRYYVPLVLHEAEHIICNSQSTAQDIVKFYNIPINKITPILLGYDSHHFHSIVEDKSKSKSQECSYFLYVGRHAPYKNISRLISAFANLPANHEYQLWLAGSLDNRYTPALKKQVQEMGLVQRVRFLGYVPYDDLPKLFREAIALVFPSLWEGFGFPVLEAMGCGTPVITSNLSSLPEVAKDAAILIDPYKVEEITDAMMTIANDAGLRSHLSELGLVRASQFSWKKTGQATVEVLKEFM